MNNFESKKNNILTSDAIKQQTDDLKNDIISSRLSSITIDDLLNVNRDEKYSRARFDRMLQRGYGKFPEIMTQWSIDARAIYGRDGGRKSKSEAEIQEYIKFHQLEKTCELYEKVLFEAISKTTKDIGLANYKVSKIVDDYISYAKQVANLKNLLVKNAGPKFAPILEKWDSFQGEISKLQERTGYISPEIEQNHEKIHNAYLKHVDKAIGSVIPKGQTLDEIVTQLNTVEPIEKWVEAYNTVLSIEQAKAKAIKGFGSPKLIKGYEGFMVAKNDIIQKYGGQKELAIIQNQVSVLYEQTFRMIKLPSGIDGMTFNKILDTNIVDDLVEIKMMQSTLYDKESATYPFKLMNKEAIQKKQAQIKINQTQHTAVAVTKNLWNGVMGNLTSQLYEGLNGLMNISGYNTLVDRLHGVSFGTTYARHDREKEIVNNLVTGSIKEMSPILKDSWDTKDRTTRGDVNAESLLVQGTNVVGDMATLIFISSRLRPFLGTKGGLFTASMIKQLGPNYNEAIQQGFNKNQAGIYSLVLSSAVSGAELIAPNKLLHNIFGGIKEGNKALIKATLGGIIKSNVLEMTKEMIMEPIQEVTQTAIQDVINVWVNDKFDKDFNTTQNMKEIAETILLTLFTTGLTSGGAGTINIQQQIKQRAHLITAQQFDDMADLLKKIGVPSFGELYSKKETFSRKKLETLQDKMQKLITPELTQSQKELYNNILQQIDTKLDGNIVDEGTMSGDSNVAQEVYNQILRENSHITDMLALDPSNTDLIAIYENALDVQGQLTPRHIQAIIDAHEAGGTLHNLTHEELGLRAKILEGSIVLVRDADGRVVLDEQGKSQWNHVPQSQHTELFTIDQRRILIGEGYVGIDIADLRSIITEPEAVKIIDSLERMQNIQKGYPLIMKYNRGSRNGATKTYIQGNNTGVDGGKAGDVIGLSTEYVAEIRKYVPDKLETVNSMLKLESNTPSEKQRLLNLQHELSILQAQAGVVAGDMESVSSKQRAINAGYWTMVFDEFETYYLNVQALFKANPFGQLQDVPNFTINVTDGVIEYDASQPLSGKALDIMQHYLDELEKIRVQINRTKPSDIKDQHWDKVVQNGGILSDGKKINGALVMSKLEDINFYANSVKNVEAMVKYDNMVDETYFPIDVDGIRGPLGTQFIGRLATDPVLMTNGKIDMHKVIQAYHNLDFIEICYNEGGKFKNSNTPGQIFGGETDKTKKLLQDLKRSKASLEPLIAKQTIDLAQAKIPWTDIHGPNFEFETTLPGRDRWSALKWYAGVADPYSKSNNPIAKKYGAQIAKERILTLALGDHIKTEEIYKEMLAKVETTEKGDWTKIFSTGETWLGKILPWLVFRLPLLSPAMGWIGDVMVKYIWRSERATVAALLAVDVLGNEGLIQGDLAGALTTLGVIQLFGNVLPIGGKSQKVLLFLGYMLAFKFIRGDDEEKKRLQEFANTLNAKQKEIINKFKWYEEQGIDIEDIPLPTQQDQNEIDWGMFDDITPQQDTNNIMPSGQGEQSNDVQKPVKTVQKQVDSGDAKTETSTKTEQKNKFKGPGKPVDPFN